MTAPATAIEVRKIEDFEYEAASRLILRTFAVCVANSMEPRGIRIFEDYAAAGAMRARDADGCATYVALHAGSLAGVLHVRNGDHISMLFVLPSLHKQGAGRALVQAADRAATLLTVHSSTNAVKVYERYGFRVCGPEQISDGIRFVPMRRTA